MDSVFIPWGLSQENTLWIIGAEFISQQASIFHADIGAFA